MKHQPNSRLDELIRNASSRDSGEAAAAAIALRQLPDEELRALVQRLPRDRSSEVRRAVIAVGPRVVPLLLAAVESNGLDWDTGAVLMQIGGRQAVPVFVRELETPGARCRELAAEALGALGAAEQVPLLRGLLGDPDPAVADEAAWSLGRLGDVESVEQIAEVARHCEFDMVAAIEGLALLDHHLARDQLLAHLNDNDSAVRMAAIRGVAKSGHRAAIPSLIRIVDTEDWLILEEALIALTEMPDPAAEPALRRIADTRPDRATPNSPAFAELARAALRAIEESSRS
jgi:HEAT repeat protein